MNITERIKCSICGGKGFTTDSSIQYDHELECENCDGVGWYEKIGDSEFMKNLEAL